MVKVKEGRTKEGGEKQGNRDERRRKRLVKVET
jgi:hypothetical protein